MKLIIISTPYKITSEQEKVNELFRQGMEIFHLRKPDCSFDEMDEYLSGINNEFHSRIILHSNYKLCDKYNLKGIHFTGKTKKLAYKYADWNINKSISCHSIEEIKSLNDFYDYIFLSPFFDSISKAGYKSTFNMKSLKIFCDQSSHNIVAMGGITPENIEKTDDFNLYGVSVLGYLWKNGSKDKIIKAFYELKASINNYSLRSE